MNVFKFNLNSVLAENNSKCRGSVMSNNSEAKTSQHYFQKAFFWGGSNSSNTVYAKVTLFSLLANKNNKFEDIIRPGRTKYEVHPEFENGSTAAASYVRQLNS